MWQLLKFIGRAFVGAAFGACFALAMFAVGLLRAGAFVAGGGTLRPLNASDDRGMGLYAGGMALGGALVLALWPFLKPKWSRYIVFAVAGIIFMTAVFLGDRQSLSAFDTVDWFGIATVGSVAGLAAGYGFLKEDSR